mgnify:CR=1 FL=1
MPRPLSTPALRALFASQTGEAFIVLLTLSHPTLSNPIRVCSDGQAITSNGNEYVAFPFRIAMPAENEGSPPTTDLEIDNVDRSIVKAIREATGEPVKVSMSVVMASSPNQVEAGPFEFTLRNVDFDASVVRGQLQYEDILNEPFPGDTMTPSRFPGLF